MKFKKAIFTILALLCVSVFPVLCFGCDNNSDENRKYDIRIRLRSNLGDVVTFELGEDKKTYEFEYTGEEMDFWVDSYNLPDHPRWGDKWFAPPQSGGNGIYKSTLYREPGGLNHAFRGPIKERGDYIIRIEADSASNIWNARVVRLYITIE